MGKALAKKFGTKSGHKMLVMSQDTNKEIASQAFRIVGIFRAEMEATEKEFVFVTIQAAQHMLKMKNKISEISLLLPDAKEVDTVADSLRALLPAVDYEVLTWRELLPFITAYLNVYDGFILIWFIIIFIAMGFGIINTTLMAVFERIREFGLLKALGMKPLWIVKEVLTESFFLLIIGMIIGTALSFGSVFVLSKTGIDLSVFAAGSEYFGISRVIYPAVYMYDVFMANLVVFVLGLLVSLYPAIKAARFTPIEALAQT